MKKTLIAMAVAAVVAVPAQATTTLYGKVRQALSKVEGDVYTGVPAVGLLPAISLGAESRTTIHDNSSRIGVKGSEDLGNGLTAIYTLEFGVGINGNEDGQNGSTGFSNRNQFVGLKGNWGTFVVGRHDTPAKMFAAKVAYMGFGGAHEIDDTISNVGFGGQKGFFRSSKRADNVLAYISPNMSGVTVAVATIAGEAATGGVNQPTGIAEGVSAAIKYANGPFHGALGYTKQSSDLLGAVSDEKILNVTLAYTPGPWGVGYMYEKTDDVAGTAGNDYKSNYLVGTYSFGPNMVAAKYGKGTRTVGATDTDYDTKGIWLEHNFSKNTKTYIAYTASDVDVAGSNDSEITSVGLELSF